MEKNNKNADVERELERIHKKNNKLINMRDKLYDMFAQQLSDMLDESEKLTVDQLYDRIDKVLKLYTLIEGINAWFNRC